MSFSLCIQLIRENRFCVLSTAKNNLPNSSLMLYVPDSGCTNIYMATSRGSLKYNNIEGNPEVSLLIDTREQLRDTLEHVKALTVYGQARIIQDEEKQRKLMDTLVKNHPSLAVFSNPGDSCVIEVKTNKFLLLDGITEAEHYTLP